MFKTIIKGIVLLILTLFSRILYIIWGNVIKMFSVLTGEWIRDIDGNTDGSIVGFHLDNESNLIMACTNNGTFVFWKTESYVVSQKIVSIL